MFPFLPRPRAVLVTLGFLFIPPLSAQDLPLIAVTEFESGIDSNNWQDYLNAKTDNFETMVETQLIKVGRYRVMERNRLDQVLSEQGLQQSLAGNETKLKVNGVDYILYGTVTEYSQETRQFSTGNFSSETRYVNFGVDVRIVDVLTGEIRRAESLSVRSEAGAGVSTGRVNQTENNDDGLADAQRVVAKKVAAIITEDIYPIRVVSVSNNEIYINYGDAILSLDDRLRVVSEGEGLIDPDTGKLLGNTEKEIAQLQVIEVNDEFSKAVLVSGNFPVTGDLVRIAEVGDAPTNSSNNRPAAETGYRGRRI